jgi:hypothetical protein
MTGGEQEEGRAKANARWWEGGTGGEGRKKDEEERGWVAGGT